MASSEHKGGVPPPDSFGEIMSGSGLQDLELSGFRGVMADRVTQWHESGLGKSIGFPLFNRDGVAMPGEFRGIMYALPLTNNTKTGHDKRVLLLFPSDERCRFLLVGPNSSNKLTQLEQIAENEEFVSQFDALFIPSGEPFIHTQWRPNPSKDPVEDFLDIRPQLFPAVKKWAEYDGNPKVKVLQEALDVALLMKAIRTASSDVTFEELLGSDAIDFSFLNKVFDSQIHSREEADREEADKARALRRQAEDDLLRNLDFEIDED